MLKIQHLILNQYEKVDGPDNGWLGYNSLAKQATISICIGRFDAICVCPVQGIDINNFEEYIEQNKPVTFTDPKVLMVIFQP